MSFGGDFNGQVRASCVSSANGHLAEGKMVLLPQVLLQSEHVVAPGPRAALYPAPELLRTGKIYQRHAVR